MIVCVYEQESKGNKGDTQKRKSNSIAVDREHHFKTAAHRQALAALVWNDLFQANPWDRVAGAKYGSFLSWSMAISACICIGSVHCCPPVHLR